MDKPIYKNPVSGDNGNTTMDDLFKKEVSELLLKHFGHVTAEAYGDLYKDKSPDFILASLTELLVEYLGEEKARAEINKLKKDL